MSLKDCVLYPVTIYDGAGKKIKTITKEEIVKRNYAMMEETLNCERIRLDIGGNKKSADTIKCQVCGKEDVEQKRAGRKYCSRKCNTVAQSKKFVFNRQASATYEEKKEE